MPVAHAVVETARASRYLVQLCRHAGHTGCHPPAAPGRRRGPGVEVEHVEWSDTHGVIRLTGGEITVRATPDALVLRAESADEDGVRRIQELLTRRVEDFGRRDLLRVGWVVGEPAAAGPGGSVPVPGRRHGRAIVAVVAGVLLVALHLGVGGALLTGSPWTRGVAEVVLALAVAKLLVVAVVVLRRRRRSVRSPRD
jgi:hypothetical protein